MTSPTAQRRVERQSRFEPGPNIGKALILEPSDIKIAAVYRDSSPTKKDVGGGLQHPLTDNNPLAVIGILGSAGVGREHRFLRLLNLQQQWRFVIRHQQTDGTECADAADPDDFEGDVTQMVTLQQDPPVFLKCLSVRLERSPRMELVPTQMVHERWLFPNSPCSGMLLDQSEMRFGALQNRSEALLQTAADLAGVDVGDGAGKVDTRAPGADRRHLRQTRYVSTIIASSPASQTPAVALRHRRDPPSYG